MINELKEWGMNFTARLDQGFLHSHQECYSQVCVRYYFIPVLRAKIPSFPVSLPVHDIFFTPALASAKNSSLGYQLVSPILGLLAYKIDFSNVTKASNITGFLPLCASFEGNGKVTLKNQVSPNVCVASRHGQFGLVVKSPQSLAVRKKMQWKLVVGCSVGAVLGTFLLGLLLVAMFVKVKKKARLEELARRAYEEEALQVSMVGHIRARTSPAT
ncbi:uncharacterized protein LOC120139404 [Hibiscus syriacus]|uniref:uncharacterized protein LOC120139404 n=1 Tax=Hibiscus syriacus TaxID=106335 RepID=UPI0019222268|nr:uncharacterized protein LOC120139404 [Hibiscus syriacus]